MLSANEDALACDLAETYGIFDYKALPVPMLATLAVGLRDDSRIKMHMSGAKIPRCELLMAAAVDQLSLLVWLNSENGRNGTDRPPSILGAIFGTEQENDKVEAFETADEYEAAWAKITGVAHGR